MQFNIRIFFSFLGLHKVITNNSTMSGILNSNNIKQRLFSMYIFHTVTYNLSFPNIIYSIKTFNH